MASGEVAWQVANMDDVWNQDAVRRYGLLRSSLVFVEMRDGVEQEHAVLDRVWDLTDDKAAFLAFVEAGGRDGDRRLGRRRRRTNPEAEE